MLKQNIFKLKLFPSYHVLFVVLAHDTPNAAKSGSTARK